MLGNDGPYIRPLTREDVPELEPLFTQSMEMLGFIANDVLMLARMPAFAPRILAFTMTVLDETTLPDELVNLVNLLASATAGCRYCVGHTANRAGEFGMEDARVAAIWDFESNLLYTDRERAALTFTFKAAQTPVCLEPADFADADVLP